MIAIIPARGGSKGLPGKNIRLLNDIPLIAYTIEAAKKAKHISRVIVSTDDKQIADVARHYGAEVPFLRPSELATDTSTAVDVYIHAVQYLNELLSTTISKFVVLLPTAPLRNEKDIDAAIELFLTEKACTLISVKKADTPLSWYRSINDKGFLCNVEGNDEKMICNRQNNQQYYVPNGAIYILDYDLLLSKRTYYTFDTIPYIMSKEKSIDIDDEIDFRIADFFIKSQYKE